MANSEYKAVNEAPIKKLGGFNSPEEVKMPAQNKYPKPRTEKVREIQSSAQGGIIGQFQGVQGFFVTATQQFYVRFTANKMGYAIAPDGNKIQAVQQGGYSVISYICPISGNYDIFIDSTATKVDFTGVGIKTIVNTSSLSLNFFGEVILPGYGSTILNLIANNCTKLNCSWLNMQTLQAPNATDINCGVNNLTVVDVPLCQTFDSFSTNTIESLNLPEGLSVNVSYNANLASLSSPKATSIDSTACKFTASAIETLLVSLVVTGKTNGNVKLTGTNMAGFSTWTANAVTAKNTLVSRGWTITYKA
jgi:hypothetical protein